MDLSLYAHVLLPNLEIDNHLDLHMLSLLLLTAMATKKQLVLLISHNLPPGAATLRQL